MQKDKVFKVARSEKNRSTSKNRTLNYVKNIQIRTSTKVEEPVEHFMNIMKSRGYDIELGWIQGLNSSYHITPSTKQIEEYDMQTITAVRKNDTTLLSTLVSMGRTMDACNIHSESLLHLACRKSSPALVTFMVEHCEQVMVDDFGRTPLHDVCWRCVPNFECARILLDCDVNMILVKDKYGACPLKYVPPSEWGRWCDFLDQVKDTYWPEQHGPASSLYIDSLPIEPISTSGEFLGVSNEQDENTENIKI